MDEVNGDSANKAEGRFYVCRSVYMSKLIDLLNQIKDTSNKLDMVKQLRDLTNGELSLAECQNALSETGNIHDAVQLLIERGEV